MNLQNLQPNSIYGWIGLGAIGWTFAYHKTLTTMAIVIGMIVGIYLYFVVDQTTSTSG